MSKIFLFFLVLSVLGCLNNPAEISSTKNCENNIGGNEIEKSKDVVYKKVWDAGYFLDKLNGEKCEKGYQKIEIDKNKKNGKKDLSFVDIAKIIDENRELIKFNINEERLNITKLDWSLFLNDKCGNLPLLKVALPVDYSIDKKCHLFLETSYHWVYEVFEDREFWLLSISDINKYGTKTSPLFSHEKLFFIDFKTWDIFYSLCQSEKEKNIPFENILKKYDGFSNLPQRDRKEFINDELSAAGKREMLRNFLLDSAWEGSVYKVKDIFNSGVLGSNPDNIKEEMLGNAIKSRQLGMVKYLVENGTNLNYKYSAASLAKETGFNEMIKFIENSCGISNPEQ